MASGRGREPLRGPGARGGPHDRHGHQHRGPVPEPEFGGARRGEHEPGGHRDDGEREQPVSVGEHPGCHLRHGQELRAAQDASERLEF